MRPDRARIRLIVVICLVFGLLFTSPPPAPVDGGLRFPSVDWTKPLDVLTAAPRVLASGASAIGRWLLGGVGAAPAAAAEPEDPADDGPSTRTEVTSERSRDAKVYREPNGTYTAEFGHGLHYEASPGNWREVDLNFRQDGSEWVADKNEVIVRVSSTGVKITDRDTGKGVTWKTPAAASVSGRKATFSGPNGLSFTYSNTPDGVKLEAVVSESIGQKSFVFDYALAGGALPLTVDAEGNLHSDAFVVPRALATGANGETYVAGVWRLVGTKVAFDFDDSSFPPEAYPYVLDPSTEFGQDSNGDDGHVYKISNSYPPGGSVSVDTASTRINVSRKKVGADYTIRNGFGKWPTASLPDAASIEGADLRVQLTYERTDDDRALLAQWYPASNWPLDAADYSSGALWSASGSIGWHIGTLVNGEVDLPLEGYATGISKTADTGIRFHIQSGQPAGINEVHFKAREDPDPGSAAKLIVVYETAPAAPTNLAPADPTTSADSTPTLSGTYSDPDPGDDGYLVFEVKEGSTVVWTNEADPDNTAVASGQTSSFTVPAGILEDGTTYTWRAKAWDGEQASSWTASRSFTLDTSSLTGTLTAPENGDTISGTTTLTATPNTGTSVGAVKFYAISQGRKRLVGVDSTADGNGAYSVSLDTTTVPDGRANLRAEFAAGPDDLAYAASPGAGAAVTVDNGAPAPNDWQAMVDAPGLAPTDETDGQVVLSNGALVLGAMDSDMPGKGFSPSFERAYNSATLSGGILGPGWRTNLEDALVPKVSGDVVHVDGAGRERTFTATFASGLAASYWNNTALSGTPALERTDGNVNFSWGTGSPGSGVNADDFSSRWQGYLDVPATGTWTLYASTDEGARLWLDGAYVINNWRAQTQTEVQGAIKLSQGRHEIRLEQFENTGSAAAVLSWAGPGVAKQVIPASAFSRVTGYTTPAGSYDTLARASDGTFTLTDPSQIVSHYTAAGQRDTVTDPHSNVLLAVYDAKDRPQYLCAESPCDSSSAAISVTYVSGTDLVDEVSDDAARTWAFSYTAGRLTTVTGPEGEVTQYRYDAAGRLDRITDAEQGVTEITYASGKVTAVKDPVAVARSGPATTIAYDSPSAGKVTIRSPEANDNNTAGEVHALGGDGQLTAVTDPLGDTTSYLYDANFNQTKETDPLGNFTIYAFDGNGNQLSEKVFDATGALVRQTLYEYDAKSNLTKQIDPAGKVTEYHYDAAGVNLLEQIEAAGTSAAATTSFQYDSAGLLTATVDPRGNAPGANPADYTTTYAYDANGNRTAEIGPLGARADYSYDAAGNRTEKAVKIDSAASAVTQYSYDAHGNVTQEIDPEGAKTTYEYDLLGRQTATIDPAGYESGHIPADYRSETHYDAAGRTTEEVDPYGKVTSYAYDWNGNVTAETDPRGDEPGADPDDFTTTHQYDAANRLVREALPDGTPSGALTTYTYDELGRNLTVTDPKGETDYAYDALGNLTSETRDMPGSEPDRTTTYEYDAAGRLLFKTDPAGNLTPSDATDYRTEYQYDDAGRLWKTIDPEGNVTEHSYDLSGNETKIKDPVGAQTKFSYDRLGRLTQRETPGSRAEDETGSVSATGTSTAEFPVTAPKAGMINAALTWDPVPALSTSSATGSLAESAKVERTIQAQGESILEGDLTWTDGTKVASQTFGPASLSAGATATHTVSVTATDAPITGSLTWNATTKTISVSDSVDALASETHDLTVNTPGRIQATLTWAAAIPNPNLDLELLDPAGAVVDDSKAFTGNSETVDYTIPSGGPTGTYKLKVISLAAGTTSYSISGQHPFFSNLNLELLKPNGQVAASSTASGSTQPEQISYTPTVTGTYTFRVSSQDQGTPSYTLAIARPVSATATVALRLKDPGGAVVWSSSSSSKTLSAISSAPDPGGAYTFEVENLSPDIDVPSWTLAMRSTVVGSGSRTGSLAEGAATNETVQAEDEGTIRASVEWDDGTTVASQPFGPASLAAGGIASHTISVTATDAPITGSLTWEATTKSISVSDSVEALETQTHNLTVNTPGRIQATLSWASGLANLDLELLDPAGVVVDDSKALTGTSETVDYAVPAGGPTGTYKLKVSSLAAQSTAYTISGDRPFYSNLNLELLKPNGQVAASATASGSTQPEQISYTPTVTGTYTFRVISQDEGTPSYALATSRPVSATATVRLRLFDPAGTQVESVQSASNAVSLSWRAPEPGGAYRVELTNVSTDIGVPSYTLHWKTPEASRYADLDLYLVNGSGGVVAEPAAHSQRPEVLTYPGAQENGQYKLRVVARTYEASFRIDYGIPIAQVATSSYDLAGRETSSTEGGVNVLHEYDKADRLTKTKLPDGTIFDSRLYDAAGHTKQITDPTGTQSFAYDRAGRVASYTDQANTTTTYSYDVAGNEEMVARDGDPSFTFGHDEQGRFESRTQGTAQTVISYGDRVFATAVTQATGEKDERAFSADGEMSDLALRPSATAPPTLELTHDYDVQGNLMQVQDVTAAPTTVGDYEYDELDRLTQETYPVNGQDRTITYSYDEQGNRTQVQGPDGTTAFSYSSAGQLVSSSGPAGTTTHLYDERGSLTKKIGPEGATSYAWTPEGRLASVAKPDGTAVSFAYDADGKRTEKQVGSATTTYAYENRRLVSVTSGNTAATFTYDESGAPLTITTGGKTYAYRTDERGSVIELTDTSNHQATVTYRYDAWGNVVGQSGAQALRDMNPYQFVGSDGVLWDAETGLYLMGARYYDPVTGRFISRDPADAERSQSSYVYAGNRPTTLIDPTGEWATVKLFWKGCRSHFFLGELLTGVCDGRIRLGISPRTKARTEKRSKRLCCPVVPRLRRSGTDKLYRYVPAWRAARVRSEGVVDSTNEVGTYFTDGKTRSKRVALAGATLDARYRYTHRVTVFKREVELFNKWPWYPKRIKYSKYGWREWLVWPGVAIRVIGQPIELQQ